MVKTSSATGFVMVKTEVVGKVDSSVKHGKVAVAVDWALEQIKNLLDAGEDERMKIAESGLEQIGPNKSAYGRIKQKGPPRRLLRRRQILTHRC